MTPPQLIAEGRQLERPTVFLRPHGTSPIAAVWHKRDRKEIAETDYRCWLTVDAQQIPGPPASITGYLTIFSDEEGDEGGRVERVLSWPERAGTALYAHTVSVLPPSDAVFARGSAAVGQWIASLGWARDDPYGGENFKTRP